MANELTELRAPKVFISYSWDSAEHKSWTKELAARLRGHGVDVTLDHWSLVPGDQLPKFMETAIRENTYVLIICTPNYKKRSDEREGGVGYEGDIMTGEALTARSDRKFIPVLRSGSWGGSMPSWLKGKYSINLSGEPYLEQEYTDLLVTLHNSREEAPPIGKVPDFRKSVGRDTGNSHTAEGMADATFVPITIKGVLADEAGRPANDGTAGSALYSIPFKLSRTPGREWSELFVRTWDRPPQWTTSHRPGIARVDGDRLVLNRTTIEEVRDTHRATLKLVVDTVNTRTAEQIRNRQVADSLKRQQEQQHRENVRKTASDITFD